MSRICKDRGFDDARRQLPRTATTLPAIIAAISMVPWGTACSSDDASPGDEAADAAPADVAQDAGAGAGDAAPINAISGVILRVVDESGAPISGATVDVGGDLNTAPLTTGEDGEVALDEPVDAMVAVVDGAGLLAEPVVVGPSDIGTVVEVRVLSDLGGARWVMHSGGDVMLGRRYEEPASGEQLLPADDVAGGARHVVEPVARAFAAADYRTVNLESVLTNLPDTAAYPQKRVVIDSKPETVAALQALSVDTAVLANNHIRDYMDVGVSETMAALDSAGIAHLGASDDAQPASAPLIFEEGGVRVGVLAWATLDGSFVNDRYAQDGDPVSSDPSRLWEYEARAWGFDGATWKVPVAERRIGTVWRMFEAAEQDETLAMSEAEIADAWASMVAVYPELQDWVARRGHGGAAYWVTSQATDEITALAERVDVVVVQLHAGLEFRDAPSDFAAYVAHKAVDAGADIVISHHPHVLQGAEWYKGKLIVHSLGNFVFDQDHFITFPSVFLRTVWEGASLVDARFVPLTLEGYRPKPLADAMFERHARLLWETSQVGTVTDRDGSGKTRVFLGLRDPDARDVHLRLRGRALHIVDTPPAAETVRVEVPAGTTAALGYAGLIHARAGGADVLLGRDILGWGSFEDALADGAPSGAAYWHVEGQDAGVAVGADAGAGSGYLRLGQSVTAGTTATDAFAHPIARMPIPEHRLYHHIDGVAVPADGAASYAVRLLARRQGTCTAQVRLDFYRTDGSRPSDGTVLHEQVLPLDIAADGDWHAAELPVPAAALRVGTTRAGAVLPQVRLSPPVAGTCELAVDEVRLIEWRPARDMPDLFGAYDHVHNPGAEAVTVQLAGRRLREP